jgi:hypothetical protein
MLMLSGAGAMAQSTSNYGLASLDSVRNQFQVDLGGGNTCYAFQRMFGWDSSHVELMWAGPDQSVTSAAAFHLPYPISYLNDAARLEDGILVSGEISGEPNRAILLKTDDAGNLQWHHHITNVYHQQNGAGVIMPHGSGFSTYVYCWGISDGAYRVEGEPTGTTWSGVEMLPPSTIRFSVNGAIAMADPTEHLLFGMGLDMTNLANFKTALIDVRDTGAVWMKLYTMPPQFSYPNDPLDVRRTEDGNYICSGSYSVGPLDKGYLMKVDPEGDVLWCRTYADTSGMLHLTSVIELPGSDLLVAGQDRYYQCLLLRLAPTGEIIWRRRSETPGSVWYPVGKFLVNDVGDRVLGLRGRLVGLTAEGDACEFVDSNSIIDSTFMPAVTSVVLTNIPFTPLVDTFTVELREPALHWQETCVYDAIDDHPEPPRTLLAFPNPTEDRVFLEGDITTADRVVVRNAIGAVVFDGAYAGSIRLGAHAAGAYVLELPASGLRRVVLKK